MAQQRTTRRLIEQRRRGFFGWVFLWAFWLFNAFMAYAMVQGIAATTEHQATLQTEAERAGGAIGAGIGISAVLFVWLAGAVILGLFALLTRGKKEMIEVIDG